MFICGKFRVGVSSKTWAEFLKEIEKEVQDKVKKNKKF